MTLVTLNPGMGDSDVPLHIDLEGSYVGAQITCGRE